MNTETTNTTADEAPKLTKPYHFDRTDVYMREIRPKVDELFALCQQHSIAADMMFQYASTEDYDATHKVTMLVDANDKKMDVNEQLLVRSMMASDCDDSNPFGLMRLNANPIWRAAVDIREKTQDELEAASTAH